MDIKGGAEAVKQHADDTGLTEGISKIIAAFGGNSQVKDIAIFSPGKLTYLREYPQKVVRVRPGGDGAGQTMKERIQRTTEEAKKRQYK